MSIPGVPSPVPLDGLDDVLGAARWFGGKGRDFEVESVTRMGELVGTFGDGEPRVAFDVLAVHYLDDDTTEHYHLPLSLYEHPQERLAHAFVSWHRESLAVPSGDADGEGGADAAGWRHAYDAVHDREAMAAVLAAFDGETRFVGPGDITAHRLPGHELDLEATSTPFPGEQSNSSVIFGDDSMLKLFRKLTPGENPDIEIHDVLTSAGSDHVASLFGWLAATSDDGPLQLGMLQQFLRTASSGWDMAVSSVRTMLAESAVADGEVALADTGSDFADEAHRLGEALAQTHATLAQAFGTAHAQDLRALAARMHGQLQEAITVVPELEALAPALAQRFDAVAALPVRTVQRIHGDLHLGQTLRTVKGWKFVDFEGEPAKPLAQRREPDSVWRDVAGMLRSFDYAAQSVALGSASADADEAERTPLADQWSQRNRKAFLAGYLADRAMSQADDMLLSAYVADKAVYEAIYEARNRPTWLAIPLAALG